jgi:hypothetical protein
MDEQAKKEAPKFDWVAERFRCSVPNVFKELLLQVEKDIETRNALRPNNSPYEFTVEKNGNDFTVILTAKDIQKSVIFSRAEHAILVLDGHRKTMFEVTPAFNDEGVCKLRVNQQERDLWQVRRMALEELLFRGN